MAVTAASPWLARVCVTDPLSLDVVADPWAPVPALSDPDPARALRRTKNLGLLRLAVRDLLGRDDVETVGANLARLAEQVLEQALAATAGTSCGLAVIGMGKLGASELNYASDVDLLLVAPGDGRPVSDARPFVELARAGWRVDLDLRPEGRSGAMVRTLASYEAYWSRWASAWEFQALLKARPVVGDPELGACFAESAGRAVWERVLGAEDLRGLRRMKARAEGEISRRGLAEREIKRGPGGIRDIEFAVQLLQLVHGPVDPTLRVGATLPALGALAAGGYIAGDDAADLGSAYRYLRTVEHRLQLYEGQASHTLPASQARLDHLSRVLGYRSEGTRGGVEQMLSDLRVHRSTARAIHERLFFRPLLEVFSSGPGAGPTVPLSAEAATARLSAFGFTDAARTRQAGRADPGIHPDLAADAADAPRPPRLAVGVRRSRSGSPGVAHSRRGVAHEGPAHGRLPRVADRCPPAVPAARDRAALRP